MPLRSDGASVCRWAQSELDRFGTDLSDLATGAIDRREEAALLDHLLSCPNCAAEFEKLVSAANSLLLLVIEIDPPVGFERRFWGRIGSCSSDTDSCGDSCATQVTLRRSSCY